MTGTVVYRASQPPRPHRCDVAGFPDCPIGSVVACDTCLRTWKRVERGVLLCRDGWAPESAIDRRLREARTARRDYEAERARVDRLIGHLIGDRRG